MDEHTKGLLDGFTKRYDVKLLVCYEFQESMEKAIKRELRIKKWERLWKIRLIEAMNPEWANLYDSEIRAIASGSAGRQAQEKPDEPDE